MLSRADLERAVPNVAGAVTVRGLAAPVQIYRDGLGIAHARAETVEDAFFAQGFYTAQDRLWHMDYDRRRAYGRWAEAAGPPGLDNDLLMRRLRLEASARADYALVSADARAMLDAYAAGVNAFIEATDSLPVEYSLLGETPEPWQPWDGLAVFKVRHVLMGTYEGKAWRSRLLEQLGPEATARLHPGYQPGHLLILPPGDEFRGQATGALEELERGAALADRLKEMDAGSNNWTLSGARTVSGKPLLAGDPHRGLDTPNVYYQNHLACPDFDVVGISFPGVPGFPHFGHNEDACWAVTHTGADYQDLYLERFDPERPGYYRFRDGWRRAEVYDETIKVRGSDDRRIKVTVTHHGPVVSGDPESGLGVAMRYTQTAEANRSAESLLNMLQAKSILELDETMRHWVDPVNNFLMADVHGNIGYLTRGQIPVRSRANAWLPVPGWTGEHEWQGNIPFNEMPRSHNPEQGYIVTANQRVVDENYPHYIGLDSAPEFRAKRITLRLRELGRANVDDMGSVHAERVSIPAQRYLPRLFALQPAGDASRRAQARLRGWNGATDPDSVAATIYSAFRLHLDTRILTHLFGQLAEQALSENNRGGPAHAARLRAHLVHLMDTDDVSLLPPGATWDGLIAEALDSSVAELTEQLGPDVDGWRWGRVHRTAPRHPLSDAFPDAAELLDPPSMPLGGDGDTPQSASYSIAAPYLITSTSVLRYIFDLSDWGSSRWITPLGASGHPGSRHYADQARAWSEVDNAPMLYDWTVIERSAESSQTLEPGLGSSGS